MSARKPKSLKTTLSQLSADRRKAIAARADTLIAEELTLRDMRKARELTQQALADLLGVKQESVSNIEKRSDLLLSTLRQYVEALGGDLTLMVKFPNRPPVALKALSDLAPSAKPVPARR